MNKFLMYLSLGFCIINAILFVGNMMQGLIQPAAFNFVMVIVNYLAYTICKGRES